MSKPVLGIMTLYLDDQKRLEERHIYEYMIKEGKALGLDVYVFTPADVQSSRGLIHAMEYEPSSRRWTRKWRAFPNMIFDRCRIQKSERFKQLLRFRARYRHLLFLNRPLRNKWTIHQILSTKKRFRPHLPDTRIVQGVSDVHRMLKEHQAVYFKPINGTGGRGILRITQVPSVAGTCEVRGRNVNRSIIKPKRMPSGHLGQYLSGWGMKDRYLVQEAINLELPDGRVHDYRMLVQKNGSGQWVVTGCVGRVGPPKSVTSNLHGGGRATAMEELLEKWISDPDKRAKVREDCDQLGVDVAQFLDGQYGGLCELALDLAIDKSGRVLLLEVNPKPSREVFAQIGDMSAYRDSMVKPLEYALYLYGQKKLTKKA